MHFNSLQLICWVSSCHVANGVLEPTSAQCVACDGHMIAFCGGPCEI